MTNGRKYTPEGENVREQRNPAAKMRRKGTAAWYAVRVMGYGDCLQSTRLFGVCFYPTFYPTFHPTSQRWFFHRTFL